MNEERNLFNLVDLISARTKLDPVLVKIFLNQFFKEIEKGLISSSCVNINGLGIFRIIRSIPSDRILFLGKFDSEKEKAKDCMDHEEGEMFTPQDSEDIEISEEFSYREKMPDDYVFDTFDPSVADSPESFVTSKEEDEIDDFLYEYDNHEREEVQRKKSSRIKFVALLVVTILLVIVLLVFLYPSEIKDPMPKRNASIHNYTEIANPDTLSYLSVVQVDSGVFFTTLSQGYYGNDVFWPIYKANENSASDLFEITSGAIIKIPRLSKDIIDINNKQSVDSAKSLQRQIFSELDKSKSSLQNTK